MTASPAAAASLPSARAANARRLDALQQPDVLILGGGVNGVATLRELALNGVPAVLLERGDYCAGASGASSRMAHGGLRYLEGREFRLVAESARERNRLLHHAPHLVKPLPIMVPLASVSRGFLRATLRFLGISSAPGPLSLLALACALTLYEFLGRRERALPRHRITLRPGGFPEGMPRGTCALACYFDALIDSPEGLVMEMLAEVEQTTTVATALNHVDWTMGVDGVFAVSDPSSGDRWALKPRIVVNAGGAWVDAVNARLGLSTSLIRGVKGAHLVVRNTRLLERMAGRAFYYDDGTGRMVICLPVGDTILMGTTEVDTSDPDDASVAVNEIDYLLAALSRLFSDIPVTRRDVVAITTGIRPLRAGGGRDANRAARDHALVALALPTRPEVPVFALVGGKWTTFRAFAEQAADRILAHLERPRTASTRDRDYPGAQREPQGSGGSAAASPTASRARLMARYGALGAEIARYCEAAPDHPLKSFPDHSVRELEWLVLRRSVCTLEDLVLRRTRVVLSGRMTEAALVEMCGVVAGALGRDAAWAAGEVARAASDPRILAIEDAASETSA